MMARYLVGALALTSAWAVSAHGGCYDLPETRPLARFAPQAEQVQVTMLVDQSLVMPAEVRQQMLSAIARLARPGTEISIGSFSSYTGSRYPQIIATVRFDYELPAERRNSVSRRGRDILAMCIIHLRRRGVAKLQSALRTQFEAARPSIGQSDIMSSIQQFSPRVRNSPARHKIVVIASDMYENSSATSFYRQRRPRMIDPGLELRNAVRRGLVGNLGGARVYILGMALRPGNEAAVPAEMVQRLERFWIDYLRRSGATGVWIGKPVLLGDIR